MFAGMLDVVDVLKNAIDRHGDTSAEGRRVVYDTARRALSNVANRSDTLSPIFAQRQREVLEEAIARLEEEFGRPSNFTGKPNVDWGRDIEIWEDSATEVTEAAPAIERNEPFDTPRSELNFTAPSIDTLEPAGPAGTSEEAAPRTEVPTFDTVSERSSSKTAWDWALSVSQQALAAAAEKAAHYRRLKLESRLSKPAAEAEPANEKPSESAGTDQISADKIAQEAATETPGQSTREETDELPSLVPLERAWNSSSAETARAGIGIAAQQVTSDDALLANIRQQLSNGLVPLDGAWVTRMERNANLMEQTVRAKWLAFQAALAISATAACAGVLGVLLLAIAY